MHKIDKMASTNRLRPRPLLATFQPNNLPEYKEIQQAKVEQVLPVKGDDDSSELDIDNRPPGKLGRNFFLDQVSVPVDSASSR